MAKYDDRLSRIAAELEHERARRRNTLHSPRPGPSGSQHAQHPQAGREVREQDIDRGAYRQSSDSVEQSRLEGMGNRDLIGHGYHRAYKSQNSAELHTGAKAVRDLRLILLFVTAIVWGTLLHRMLL